MATNPDIASLVLDLYYRGESLRDVARRIERSHETVRRILIANRVKLRPRGRPKD